MPITSNEVMEKALRWIASQRCEGGLESQGPTLYACIDVARRALDDLPLLIGEEKGPQ